MNIILQEKIGEGLFGSVYKVKFGNDAMIYKIQKITDYDGGLKSEYHRAIDFNKIAKKHPDKLMVLKSYGIIENCDYKKEDSYKNMDPKGKKFFEDRNKSSNCCYYIYSPLLEGTLDSIRYKIVENDKLYYDLLYQVIECIDIMRKHGFVHNDLQSQNIMYKSDGIGYKWYIVDYGSITHHDYPQSKLDKLRGTPTLDLITFIRTCCIINTAQIYLNKNKIDYPTNKKLIDRIKKSKDYDDIKSYIPIQFFDYPVENENNINMILLTILILKYYDVYKEYIGINKLVNVPTFDLICPNKELLGFIIKKCNSSTYSNILKKIRAT